MGGTLEGMNRVIPVSLVVLLLTVCACSIFTPQTGEPRISFIPTGVPETFFTPERTGMFSGINDGSLALQYLKELSHFGSRALNEPGHARASEYIENSLMRLGYSPVKQNFVTSNELPALNLLVDKAGQSSQVILIGAHYDSVNTGSGIDDNGSGVAILLEMANRLKDKETPYSLRFVFLDAEETGLEGSKYYVSQMSQDDIQNTLAMINLDSLAVGDHTYIYGNEGDEGPFGIGLWIMPRDRVLT
jgi:acetylornithine deacetylase/succinyl-diaminopimelate desuccinylase-like protein